MNLIYESKRTQLYLNKENNEKRLIKRLREPSPSQAQLDRFLKEFYLSSVVDSSRIRKVFAAGKHEGFHSLTLEYVPGEVVHKVFSEKKQSLHTFLVVAIQITKALNELHNAHIIHKDINGYNIMVDFTEDGIDVKIIDLGIASQTDLMMQHVSSTDHIEGTLAYISPEQTGRMNRVVDYRTDLYSLGVTFYEMLTQRLPFDVKDALELVHAHIAMIPPTPREIDASIPKVVSEMVMKLLSKNAEQRYQSAYGLQLDLEKCLSMLQEKGEIENFAIGENDVPLQFKIQEKLYGRELELRQLVDVFEKTCSGEKQVVYVHGEPGIGKTALVKELHSQVAQKQGFFIEGKFNLLNRDIPYSGIIKAFSEQVNQLLSLPEKRLQDWKVKILTALGNNGKIVTDVIPSLELIIGEQPDVEKLPPAESHNRFKLVFQDFVKIFASASHPLVAFIDDLQWADRSSFEFIQTMFEEPDLTHIMFITSYRDTEVDEHHPLVEIRKKFETLGHHPVDLHLTALKLQSIEELLSETLHCTPGSVKKLCELIYKKTSGNPFFVKELMISLYQKGLFYFKKGWHWDEDKIAKAEITDNVADLMISKLNNLPEETLNLIKLASCAGNSVKIELLQKYYNLNEHEISKRFIPAVREGLFIQNIKQLQFVHDRVREAASSLISENEKSKLHYYIGKYLVENTDMKQISNQLFSIAEHFNKAIVLLDVKEKNELLLINIDAGKKAKASTAYLPAINYFKNAKALLPSDLWETDYDKSIELHIEWAEAEFMATHFADAEKIIGLIKQKAKNKIDSAKASILHLSCLASQDKYMEAIEMGISTAKDLGLNLPRNPGQMAAMPLFFKLQYLLRNKNKEELLNYPNATDPQFLLLGELTLRLIVPVFLSLPNLFPVIGLQLVILSLKHGYVPQVVVGYFMYAVFLQALSKIDKSYEFYDLTVDLAKKLNNKTTISFINFCYNCKKTLPQQKKFEGYNKALESAFDAGDLEYGAWDVLYGYISLMLTGENLEHVREYGKKRYPLAVKMQQENQITSFSVIQQGIDNLLGKTQDAKTLTGDHIIEKDLFSTKESQENINLHFYFAIPKTLISVLFGRQDEILKLIKFIDKNEMTFVTQSFYLFTRTLFGLVFSYLPDDYKGKLNAVKKNRKYISKYLKYNFDDHKDKYFLLSAEIARLSGTGKVKTVIAYDENQKPVYAVKSATQLYDLSVRAASKQGHTIEEALANEFAAKYCFSEEINRLGQGYMREAYHCYKKWGCTPKVNLLEESYPFLKNISSKTNETVSTTMTMHSTLETTTLGSCSALDVQSIVKASQNLSGEIVMENLLRKLMSVLFENAGAQKGMLLNISDNRELRVTASGKAGGKLTVLKSDKVSPEKAPLTVLNYVVRSQKTLVLENASQSKQFNGDAYIRVHQTESILCHPILHKGKIFALLYLENNLSEGTFTADRIEIINILGSQVAISLDNAQLYENLEEKVQERTQKLNEANKALKHEKKQTDASIRYAQTIQKAILPESKDINKAFESFVIFRPKDIVSGDFYWFADIKDNGQHARKVFVAAVDCTGHGVPGAFMSMIGNSLFNKIVREMKTYSPTQILEQLHLDVKSALKQDVSENDDGMDVCLCCFEPMTNEKTKLVFSGAKRPLIHYSSKNKKTNVYKGAIKTIGGKYYDGMGFNEEEIILEPDDMVYLTTDGYTDQSNVMRKRFKFSQFLELIEKNAEIGLNAQKKLLENALDNHQSETSQRDDITVIGVRMPLRC